MVEKTKVVLYRSILVLFAALTLYSLYGAIREVRYASYFKKVESLQSVVLIVGGIFAAAVVFLIYNRIIKMQDRYVIRASAVLFGAMVILQFVYILVADVIPKYDHGIIYTEAIEMLTTGTISPTYNVNYYSMYPNNHFSTILLYLLFRVCKTFGITNYNMAGELMNLVFVDAAVYITYRMVCSLGNKKRGLLFLAVMAINPLIYLYIPNFYTRTLTYPFMMGAAYAFLLFLQSDKIKKKMLYIALSVSLGYVGLLIRATAFFPVIAGIVYLIVRENKIKKYNKEVKKDICRVAAAFVAGLVITVGITGAIRSRYVQFDYSKTEYPITHWIMMGLSDRGEYSLDDLYYTRSHGTYEERKEANIEEIKRRISDKGASGLLKLAGIKMQTVWSDGSMGVTSYMFNHEEKDEFYDTTMGTHDDLILYCIQIYHIAMLAFMLYATVKMIMMKRSDASIIAITVLGGMLFHLIWEAQRSYGICFLICMVFMMTLGAQMSYEDVTSVLKKIRVKNLVMYIMGAGSVFTMVMFIMRYDTYTDGRYDRLDFLYYQDECSDSYVDLVDGVVLTEQFTADRVYNTVRVKLYNMNKSEELATYNIRLLDSEKNVICKKSLTNADIGYGVWIKMFMGNVIPDGKETYYLELSSEGANESNCVRMKTYYCSGADICPNASMMINDIVSPREDMEFRVYNNMSGPYTTKSTYMVIALLAMAAEVYVTIRMSKEFDYVYEDDKDMCGVAM